MKSKEKGNVKNTLKVTANAVNFLNGEFQSKNTFVPVIFIDYEPPESAMEFAKGETLAMWIKLEDAQYKQIVSQLKKNLREITIWFKNPERDKIGEFLKNTKGEQHG